MQIGQNGSDVVVFARARNQAGGSILYLLKLFHNLLRRQIIQERVAVVKLGEDKSMDENLGSLGRKEFSYVGNVTQVVEG